MTKPCSEMRERMTDASRGLLAQEARAELDAHLKTCAECTAALEREAVTDQLLDQLPRRNASEALKARLRERLEQAEAGMERAPDSGVAVLPRARRAWLLGLAAAAVVATAAVVAFVRLGPSGPEPMVVEAVNDHLRVLYAQNPLEVAASDQHQVKPWFTGKVDFGPVLRFGGDDRFILAGGAVALYVDRKAALFVWKRRLHEITLLNFRGDSLPWPRAYNTTIGGRPALTTTHDGFHVVLWRADELGYVLTSDLSEPELRELAELLIAGAPHR